MLVWTLALLGLVVAGGASAQSVEDPGLGVSEYVSGLSQPTTMAFLGPDDLLVLEKATGDVRRVVSGQLQASPVLSLSVSSASERGLLGIAIDESDPQNVFLYYTQASPLRHIVARYQWDGVTSSLVSGQTILDLPATPGPNHDGGILVLGPPGEAPGQGDGSLLYVVIGDLNRQGVLQNVPLGPAEDDTSVIFRIRQDGVAATGNPFTGTAAPYFAYGVRNSFGMALDPVTGALWDTENGPNRMDEINRVDAGFNSGWRPIMGPESLSTGSQADLYVLTGSSYSDPEFSWDTPIGVTAIVFPHDGQGATLGSGTFASALGATYNDVALVAASNNGEIYRFPLNPARTGFDLDGFTGLDDLVADSATERSEVLWADGFGTIADIKTGPDGSLYVSSLSSGRIYRVAQLPSLPALPQAWGALCALALVRLGVGWLRPGRAQPS